MAAFLVDAQLPPGLAHRLQESGHQAFHVTEIGLASAPDIQIAHEASRRRAILVSKDEDFAALLRAGAIDCAVLWIRLGNTTNDYLWSRVGPLMAQIVAAFERGEKIVEFHRRPRLVK